MNSKSKALNNMKDEKRVAHKAVGGTLYFSNPKSSAVKKHQSHVRELEGRKKSFHKFVFGKS